MHCSENKHIFIKPHLCPGQTEWPRAIKITSAGADWRGEWRWGVDIGGKASAEKWERPGKLLSSAVCISTGCAWGNFQLAADLKSKCGLQVSFLVRYTQCFIAESVTQVLWWIHVNWKFYFRFPFSAIIEILKRELYKNWFHPSMI
jgi:hypothetical protein